MRTSVFPGENKPEGCNLDTYLENLIKNFMVSNTTPPGHQPSQHRGSLLDGLGAACA